MDALNALIAGLGPVKWPSRPSDTRTHVRFSISEQFIDKNESGDELRLRQLIVTLDDPNVARISVNNTCDKFRFTENVL